MKKIFYLLLYVTANSCIIQAMEQKQVRLDRSIIYATSQASGELWHMEDTHFPEKNQSPLLANNTLFFGIYDGHCGDSCACYLRDYLHECITKHQGYPATLTLAIQDGFMKANSDYIQSMKENGTGKNEQPGFCGSTASIVILHDDKIVVGNVGDSRVVLCCDNGIVQQLSEDHTFRNPEEKKRTEDAGATIFYPYSIIAKYPCGKKKSLVLSRSIGDFAYKYASRLCKLEEELDFFGMVPDLIRELKIYNENEQGEELETFGREVVTAQPFIFEHQRNGSESFLVLASAGLWNVMSNQEVVGYVQSELKTYQGLMMTSEVAQKIVDRLLRYVTIDRDCNDDVTITIIFFK